MRRMLSIGVLIGLVAGLAYVVRARGLDRMLLQDTRLGAPPSAVATPWKTEEEWLAGEVARDIVEMAFYARHRRAPAAGETTAHAKVTGAPGVSPIGITLTSKGMPDATVDLPLAFIWGAGEYVPVARLASSRMGLPATAKDGGGAGTESSLVALTEPTVGILERENQRVSAILAERPQDSAAHESAALVLAALALREAAGLSHDTRPTLSRMTAHLTLADAWRQGAPTPDGRVSHAALLVLANRGADAESALAALPVATAAERAWRDALFVRLTDDWRRLPDPRNATLLERMVYVRTLMRVGTHSSVLGHLADIARDGIDYEELARVAMDDSTVLTVEAGNTLLGMGLAFEERGLAQVYRMAHGKDLAERAPTLHSPPDRAITASGPRVIGAGAWSAYFRRHLLHQMTLDEMHTRRMLSLPQEADARGRKFDAAYGTLPQYSFLLDRRESHGGIRPTRFAESVAWTIDRPEQVTAFHFFVTEDLAAREVIRRGPAPRAKWFDPPLPRGTTFDSRFRRQALGFEPKGAEAEAFRVLSPRDPAVLSIVAGGHPKGAPIADLEKRLGPRIDYDVTLLGELAGAAGGDRPQLELLNRRRCAIGPRWCGGLGVFLAEDGRDDEAAVAVRAAFDNAVDRVGASWYAPWLVDYYGARGRARDAMQVAENAESTGSGSGMAAMAAVLEDAERFTEAEQVLVALRTRYGDDARSDPPEHDDNDPLIGLYHRLANVRGDATYSERFKALSSSWFPAGLEKLDPKSLDARAASEGVAILKQSETTRRAGLKPGDVIVGVDGYRVRTVRQYHVARQFRRGSEMDLHVWRYPGFQTIKTRTWARWFDTDLRTNTPGEPSSPG